MTLLVLDCYNYIALKGTSWEKSKVTGLNLRTRLYGSSPVYQKNNTNHCWKVPTPPNGTLPKEFTAMSTTVSKPARMAKASTAETSYAWSVTAETHRLPLLLEHIIRLEISKDTMISLSSTSRQTNTRLSGAASPKMHSSLLWNMSKAFHVGPKLKHKTKNFGNKNEKKSTTHTKRDCLILQPKLTAKVKDESNARSKSQN